ncbi:DUF4139 domain-containing protein [Parasphingorhabdus sp. JC815]|uniref:DUF4139 domain-containing protein n=1 Tax=Parasphingorhabdus sp. JC815 TaxID=3232140 RepID=UPI00345A1D4B
MRLLALTGLALILATPAIGQSSGQGDIAVTIYNDDLALVQDRRQLNIPSGRSVQTFPGVSGQIRAETVGFNAADTGIVEQNFDYDLLSPAKLMEKAVGETVTIVRINPATGNETRERAKVLAANGGVVLQIGGRIEVLRDDRLPTRVIFDKVPNNLRARPTLSVTLNSTRSGRRPAQLSYLTSGMSWEADYVALFDENAGKMDVQGWVTLTNSTGTTFDNAKTLLVAGTPSVNGSSMNRRGRRIPRNNIRQAGTESPGREALGDFYLYPLAERTTIANAQTKQVSFLDVTGAPAQKTYEYTNRWLGTQNEPQSAATVLQFSSSANGGLVDALPAGTVRVYMKDASGQPQFIGENTIGHTPMGSELGLKTGVAFDVKVKPTVTERRRLSPNKWRSSMAYEITNARSAPVTVSLIQDGLDFYWSDTRIVDESLKSERRSSRSIVWKVPVPAKGKATVTATFETRF